MAAPMRSNSQEGSGHRTRVADTRGGSSNTAKPDIAHTNPNTATTTNFEYDDNEWDIGIGDLIIDLDADIEKTNEVAGGTVAMATNNAGSPAGSGKTAAKLAIEHSATVDKGLKMKIKRTKPGTKTSEAKHEIVKSNEQQQQNGTADGAPELKGAAVPGKHPPTPTAVNSGKRGSGGHRRDKAREKHGDKPPPKVVAASPAAPEVNGVVRASAPQPAPQRPAFPASAGPGPPPATGGPPPPGPPPSPAAATAQGSAAKPEQAKGAAVVAQPPQQPGAGEEGSASPPPPKKFKGEPKEVTDVCVGTSVGTITEPDCLGPCEPGTSVTLEGIVWHETEGGVLVVNVTWRGKTYVGTLLDCTRHDWAPPRFCDSPTSDLDTRTPKGRETRSSVNSKLRNGGVKGRRGAANGSGPSTAPSSPTPFVPPRPEPTGKRKARVGEEDGNAPLTGKKTKVSTLPTVPCSSPPPSPVLLECPEPNCSKKYKHINGLKYHQSHAHGSVAEDDDTKDATSMSENDESNIEAPSPATPVKSPEKGQDGPPPGAKDGDIPLILRGSGLPEAGSQPGTPRSASPATPQEPGAGGGSPAAPPVDSGKAVVKPGILRYGGGEEFPVGVFGGAGKNQVTVTGTTPLQNQPQTPVVRSVAVSISPEPTPQQQETPPQPQSFANQLQAQVNTPSQQFTQPPALLAPAQNAPTAQPQAARPGSPRAPPSPAPAQFKVKPAAALMPDDKKKPQNSYKKRDKNRKSPAGSPDPPQAEQLKKPIFSLENSGRDEVQSPAYSDISDDGAPMLDSELGDKSKNSDKKTDLGQQLPHMPQYGMYPFYSQPPYLVPTVQNQDSKKEPEKAIAVDKPLEKDPKKEGSSEYQQKVLQQHYYPYSYVPGYTYNMDPNFGSSVPMVAEDKIKEERIKEEPSPADHPSAKASAPIPNPIQVPTPGKVKTELGIGKEKHQNENHQILKESIEMKSQMNSYIYSRQQQQQQQSINQREEDVRRFYIYSDQQRRKDQPQQAPPPPDHAPPKPAVPAPAKQAPPPSPAAKHKPDARPEDRKDRDAKQEGVKPTMETQGPPPPPTSQYAYIHPGYMQPPYHGMAFDPGHPAYRGLVVPGPYGGGPYLHQLPRYHAPEDLSRAPPQGKTLDMLQHHAQYYSSHKIHELQERALKSPTPKAASASPVSSTQGQAPPSSGPAITTQAGGAQPQPGKQTPGDGKESRSPPPQRHVHTHHHTHVGLGYPMYPAPYGAAVLASQQAAAVTVINPYPPK